MRDPDIVGPAAQAWKHKGESDVPDHQAALAQYVLTGPFHPAWNWWMVGLISLREIPGVPPPHKQYPDAEYEFMILSINPDCCPPDPDAVGTLSFLSPPDLIYQFDVRDEAAAEEIATLAVRAICDGKMSPDQDYRARWRELLDGTVQHYKEGRH